MGVAYFIVLDHPDPGFDLFVNGKAVARARADLYRITGALGLPGIDDLASFVGLDDELGLPAELRDTDVPWFEPHEGLRWVTAVRQHVEANPASVKEPDEVLSDLAEYEQVLRKAEAIGAKWHFEMDL